MVKSQICLEDSTIIKINAHPYGLAKMKEGKGVPPFANLTLYIINISDKTVEKSYQQLGIF